MRFSKLLLLTAIASSSSAKTVDVSKGTDVIPPDSKEAAAFHDSDKAVKTSPKDNTVSEDLVEGGDNYKKSQPKIDHQKIDIPDIDEKDNGLVDDDHPVVLNDYDPNNIGVTAEKEKEKEREKESNSKNKHKSKNKDTSSSTSSTKTEPNESANANPVETMETTKHKQQGTSAFHSFTMSASMILFSEVGDKTFLIAALMAMKHPRITVFSAALSSLAVMSVLSAFLGHALPTLLPKKVTSLLAAVLFVVFGVKLAREGMEMKPGVGVDEEMEEVEHEIEEKEMAHRDDDMERGFATGESVASTPPTSKANNDSKKEKSTSNGTSPRLSNDNDVPLYTTRRRGGETPWEQFLEGVSNLASLVLSPIWVQVFVMTFLGEWGDRSQVATIAMAAGSEYWFVILGAVAGHAVCTGAAVLGGRLLATKISMRHVTLAGAVAFIIFAVIYFVEGISLPW